MPKISVVIPCYNAEKWLKSCLGSLSRQTFADFEIIAVNDSSTDNTLTELQKIGQHEKRLRILSHAMNGGVSAARNTALASVQGEFVTFLDADDQFPIHALEQFALKVDTDDADLICLNAIKCDEKGNALGRFFKNCRSISFNPYEDKEIFYQNQNIFASACVKLYRSSLIQELKLSFNPALNFGEDTLFVHQYVLNCKKIIVNSSVIAYHYTQQSDSAVHTINLEKRLAQLEYLVKSLQQLSIENKFGKRLCAQKCAEYIWSIKKYAKNEKELENTVRTALQNDFFAEILHPTLTQHGKLKHRMLIRCLKSFPKTTMKMW